MTLPDRTAPRKPRRLGLYAPFALAIVLAGAWCVAWFWLAGETRRRIDAERDLLVGQDWRVSWSARHVSGFPFRLDVDFEGLTVREPSGWAIAAPILDTEAWAYAPDHWMLVAPDGVVLTRRRAGKVSVTAKVLRASVSGFDQSPPRVSVEGLDLAFTAAPGANPFSLSTAKELHIHTRAGPGDHGAAWLELDGARARFPGLMGRIAGGKPVSLLVDLIYSHAAALAGPSWPAAARAWRDAGGTIDLHRLRIAAGDALLDGRGGRLSVDGAGRLQGSLTATLGQASRTLRALNDENAISPDAAGSAATVLNARSHGTIATVTIDFQAGRTTLGPAAIGPAPRIF